MANPNSAAQRSFAAEPYDSVAAVLASKQITAALAGQRVHTKNGFAYDVLPADASKWHLTTAGGAKLMVCRKDGCFHAEAFGVVTGDLAYPALGPVCTEQMQAALNALKSRDTLVLPSGTIFTGNLEMHFGVVAVSFVGQGTFGPPSAIQYIEGADDGMSLPHEAYEFSQISFRGTDAPGSYLFKSTRTDGYADQDWSFTDCQFTHANHVGYLKGRGLTVDRCQFGKINGDAFIIDHPSAAEFIPGGSTYMQSWEGGFRGFTVRNCRFHGLSSYIFRVEGENKANARGFTLTGNTSDSYARIIKGYAQEVLFSGNNWYIGWNSANATMFDLVDVKQLTITGNIISNAGDLRQVGDNPFIHTTGNVRGITVTGNTFGRRDVPIWDGTEAANSRSVRDVTIANNTYEDCFVTASFFARCKGATGLVQNVNIDEAIYEAPTGWHAVKADTNWRSSSVKVKTRHADTVMHDIPNIYSRDNEPRTGSFMGTGAELSQFVGYPPKSVKIYKNDGTLGGAKIQSGLSSLPPKIAFTSTGFTVSTDASVNTSGTVYYWEAA